jgi:hypothetical protein
VGPDTGVRHGARQRSHFEVLESSIVMSLADPGPKSASRRQIHHHPQRGRDGFRVPKQVSQRYRIPNVSDSGQFMISPLFKASLDSPGALQVEEQRSPTLFRADNL